MPRHWNNPNSAGGYRSGLLQQNNFANRSGLLQQNNLANLLRSRRATVIDGSPESFASTTGPADAAAAIGSYANRNAPRNVSPLFKPGTMRTEGRKVSDIFRDAQLGKFGAREGRTVSDIFKGAQLGQFGARVGIPAAAPSAPTSGQFMAPIPDTMVYPEPWIQGTLPDPRTLPDIRTGAGGQRSLMNAETPVGQDNGDVGPQGFMSKIGGFLNKPGVGQSMMAAGARMMQGSPDGTFATIGHGLETGLDTYEGLKEGRRAQSSWEEDERRRKEVNAGVEAAIREQRNPDGTILRRALNDEEAAMVRGAGGAEGVALAAGFRQGTRARSAIETFAIGANDDYLELLKAQPDNIALAAVTEYAKTEEAEAGRVAHLIAMGYSKEVAEDAAKDAASTQAVLNRGMETTIMRDGRGVLRVFHNGEYAGGFGDSTPVSGADAATLAAMKLTSNWDMLADLRTSVTENYEVLAADVQRLENVAETIRAVNDEDLDDYFGPTGNVRATFAAWAGLEDAAKIQNVRNLLERFGIQNLADFKGAISEMELALALENAGSITQVKGLINAVLSRAMDNTIDKATTHNSRAQNLDSQFLDAETLQPVGEFFSKPNAFGFDTESLADYATERDQIFDEWLDRATGKTIDVRSDEFFVPDEEPEMGILDVRSPEDYFRLQAQRRRQ